MKNIVFLIFPLLLVGCNTSKNAVVFDPPTEEEYELRDLDTLVITAPPYSETEELEGEDDFSLAVYNPSHKRVNDLLHTKLDLRFDWQNEHVLGKATLTLEPYFYPTQTLVLDAKDFDIHSVSLENTKAELKYEYDNEKLVIDLGKRYKKGEKYSIFIDYTAKPAETGGSAAITSDQGLFFINSSGEEGDKPQQIWTQGETEWNSRWFPTIDKPNERCTQEMLLTVQDRFSTLSNGILISSTPNNDGTRTDYWKMDQPHAPYLFMVAVGEYAVVKENWKDVLLEYYVEPKFESSAKDIFSHTPEMLDFFSEKLGMKYPWPKYSQIVVRDYVSGAMENTTAVIYGEFVQKTSREIMDEHNEKIVAHELFHHWFGDYVTCESWANLTMNEGFANYSEYLWLEHKYGKDEADYHMLEEWSGYFSSARNNAHPLIHYGHEDKEEMFDAHSYNKGGSVLHMLRNYVGDEAFFAALNLYLTDNAYSAVEVHDLRLAFEEVTGEDLNWFFNQWYLNEGHPILDITYAYDDATQLAIISVEQIQDPNSSPAIFELPASIDIYHKNGKKERKSIRVNQRQQTFTFPVEEQPNLMVFDAENVLLAQRSDNRTEEEMIFQYRNAPGFLDRYTALEGLTESNTDAAKTVLKEALNDNFWLMRALALSTLDIEGDKEVLNNVKSLAVNDKDYNVRTTAIDKLIEFGGESCEGLAKEILEKEQSYTVLSAALVLLREADSTAVLEYAEKLEKEKNSEILSAVSIIYGESGDASHLNFFEENLNEVDGFEALSFFNNYQTILSKTDTKKVLESLTTLKGIALDNKQSPWRRIAIAKAMNDVRNDYRQKANEEKEEKSKESLEAMVSEISTMFDQIKDMETNDQLKLLYEQFQLIDKA